MLRRNLKFGVKMFVIISEYLMRFLVVPKITDVTVVPGLDNTIELTVRKVRAKCTT